MKKTYNINFYLFFFAFALLFCSSSLCLCEGNFFNMSIESNGVQINHYCKVTDDLQDNVDSQLDNLKEEEFEKIIDGLTQQQSAVFGNVDFTQKIKDLISGNGQVSVGELFSFIVFIALDNFANVIPILASICGIAILSNFLLQLRGKNLNKPLGDVIHFVCYAVVVVLVMGSVLQLVKITSDVLSSLQNQMEIIFPLLLTIMAGLGASSSVSIYQPVVAVLCGGMMTLFTKIILPLFSLSIIFGVIGNLSTSVKLSKLSEFFKNTFKYVIGFTFTIFSGVLAVSGIMAGSYDGISIRATKYAIKSYVPIMGGYLSDGFSLIMASSVLIKNAIGYSGLLIMFLTIASPLLKIILYKLGLNLVAGIIEPVADSRMTNFISQTAKSLSMLSSVILAFSFAYLVCVGLMMCTSNLL